MAVQKKLQKSVKKRPTYPPKSKNQPSPVKKLSLEKLVLDQTTGTIAEVTPAAVQSTESPIQTQFASEQTMAENTASSDNPSEKPQFSSSSSSTSPTSPLHNTAKTPDSSIPSVDTNAPQKMEKAAHATMNTSEIPTMKPDTTIKIEEVEPIFESDPNERSNKRLLLIVLGIAALIAFAGIGIFFYQTTSGKPNNQMDISMTPTSPPPTATPSPVFQPSQIPFEVQNGSGISGEAARAAGKIGTLGFPVVKVGNADRSDYSNIQLIISEDISSISAELLKSLEKEFNIATTSATLKNTTASARLIIGKN